MPKFCEKGIGMKKLRYVILVIAVCTFVFSAYKLIDYFSSVHSDKVYINDVIDRAVSVKQPSGTQAPDETTVQNEEKAPECPITVDFEKLWSETNKDIVAWLYSPDTEINFPIVQSSDNNYYLRRRLDGKYSISGTPFMDFRNAEDFSDFNSIIYGHNMKTDMIFGTLPDYEKQEYYDKHSVMWLITPTRSYRLDILAGYYTSPTSDSYKLYYDRASFDAYIEQSIGKSTFKSNFSLDQSARIVTLSTCSDTDAGMRYVLLGYLRETE